MNSSLAFMGAALVAFATGSVLITAVDSNHGTSDSHATLFLRGEGGAPDQPRGSTELPSFLPDSARAVGAYGVFVPNLGQVRHDVYFQFISPDQVASFRATSIGVEPRSPERSIWNRRSGVNVRFVGANRRPQVRATGRVDTSPSYIGDVVPRFSEITYSELYEGVDLRVLASSGGVTRMFTLAPGAPTARLLMYYDGADHPVPLSSGALRVSTSVSVLTYPPPTAYQRVNGTIVPVPVRYEMGRFGSFGFSVGPHDAALPLVIEMEGV